MIDINLYQLLLDMLDNLGIIVNKFKGLGLRLLLSLIWVK